MKIDQKSLQAAFDKAISAALPECASSSWSSWPGTMILACAVVKCPELARIFAALDAADEMASQYVLYRVTRGGTYPRSVVRYLEERGNGKVLDND